MLAAVRSPTEFPRPREYVGRAAGRLLLVAVVIALANAAVFLTLHAGAAGVSQFVNSVAAPSERRSPLSQPEAPTALRGPGVRSLFGTAAPLPCEDRAPAAVGIRWTAGRAHARRAEAVR